MSFNLPSPTVPFPPLEHVRPKIHPELILPYHPDRSIHVVLVPRDINATERVREPRAVVCEKDGPRRELVTEPDCVSRRNLLEQPIGVVVPTTVRVFVEFRVIVEVQCDAETLPPREPPLRVWKACSPYREQR